MKHFTETPHLPRGLWFVLSMLIINCCLFTTNTYGGNKKMKPSNLYDIKEAKSLDPQIFTVKTTSSLSLFPVPQNNSIGTNDMNNAITLISFPKGKIDYDKYFKNAFEQVGGGGEYIPVISPDTIGFGQTRRFVLYNFKTKKHSRYRVAASIDESIQKIAIASAWLKHFVFEIKGYDNKSEDHKDYTSSLQLIDLSGEESKLLKKIPIETGAIWSVVGDKNFLYRSKTKHLQIFNMNLEPAQHPLADVIKHNKDKINFAKIHAHPTLPFAILDWGTDNAVFISWGQGRESAPVSILGDREGVSQFSFSPDGKWVTFQGEIDLNTHKTYLMPVSEKYPHYLGTPILLSQNPFNENNFGWTNQPVSFVGSSIDKLYRWDLENQDYPGKGRLSFHDYIVEKDLEKLTKDKRQGLGGK